MGTTFKLELNSKPKKDGTSGILIRITQEKKHKRISTGIFINAKDFNKKAEYGKWIRKSNPSFEKINDNLITKLDSLKYAKSELEKKENNPTSSQIIKSFNQGNTQSFINYFEQKVELYKKLRSPRYFRNLSSKLATLKEYLDKEDLLFQEVDVDFINNYEAHLIGSKKTNGKPKKPLAKNTIIAHKKVLRTILYSAFKEDIYTGKNPFLVCKIGEMKTNVERLTMEEIGLIEDISLEKGSRLWHTRNYFLFAFYIAGKRIGDVMQLKWENIRNGRLIQIESKTNKENSVKLIDQALEIIELYKSHENKPADYLFPILGKWHQKLDPIALSKQLDSKDSMINKDLKKIQKIAGISKKIHFHISRHSAADNFRKNEIPITSIRTLLTHSSNKQVETYLNQFDHDAEDRAMDKAYSRKPKL